MKCIVNGKIILENKILEGKVLVFDEKIVDISDEVPQGCEIIDAKGQFVSPGFIDIHIHGNMGKDTMDATEESVTTIAKSVARYGVTSFLPTTMTMDKESIYNALDVVKELMGSGESRAEILGAHLEGPFIHQKYKGAQNETFIAEPSYEFIKKYKDVIKVITYAPENDENYEFTKEVVRNTNIALSIGHSKSTYKQAMDAINLGARNITHMFNGMTPLNHRNPGVVGAALTSNAYCEIIADTIHITTDLFQFILDNKGEDKIILITDSIEAGGLEDGEYSLGGQKVVVKDSQARLESGSLAGSVMPLNKMVYNFLNNTNLDVRKVVKLASLNPAKSIGVDKIKGSIEIGKDADIAIFDENINCYMTINKGNVIFKK
ncbi:N-acetylglucosamine-6-phosphate deacetylase [Faecalimicrobium sp. JNUCC 81]